MSVLNISVVLSLVWFLNSMEKSFGKTKPPLTFDPFYGVLLIWCIQTACDVRFSSIYLCVLFFCLELSIILFIHLYLGVFRWWGLGINTWLLLFVNQVDHSFLNILKLFSLLCSLMADHFFHFLCSDEEEDWQYDYFVSLLIFFFFYWNKCCHSALSLFCYENQV